eukprot:9503983-Pyramimonas_sp.AAC.1
MTVMRPQEPQAQPQPQKSQHQPQQPQPRDDDGCGEEEEEEEEEVKVEVGFQGPQTARRMFMPVVQRRDKHCTPFTYDSAEALGRLALTKLPPPQQPQTAETAAPAPAAPTGCFRARAETTPRRAGAYNISTCFAGAKRFGRTDPSIW